MAQVVALIDVDSPILKRFGDDEVAVAEAAARALASSCDWGSMKGASGSVRTGL
jgi:putative methionine-R-sulfoxide reductase with GAF domain